MLQKLTEITKMASVNGAVNFGLPKDKNLYDFSTPRTVSKCVRSEVFKVMIQVMVFWVLEL
jgi:hypothetical protein